MDKLVRTGSASRLRLARFDRDAVGEQLGHLRGAVPDPDLVDEVEGLSIGVPLFVEELADALDSHADLSQMSGLLHGHRLAGLPTDALHLVETAAVAVTPPSTANLLVASDLAGDDFDRALAAALDAGVLILRRPLIDFRHAVLREATLERMLPHRERELHLRWADVLEAEADGLEAAVTVAHHRLVAAEPSAALVACVRAADVAGRASGFAVQLEMLRHVARLWPRVDCPEELAMRDLVDVLGQAAEAAYFASGDATQTQRLVLQASALLPADSPPARRAWLDLLALRSRYSQSELIPVEQLLAVGRSHPARATDPRAGSCLCFGSRSTPPGRSARGRRALCRGRCAFGPPPRPDEARGRCHLHRGPGQPVPRPVRRRLPVGLRGLPDRRRHGRPAHQGRVPVRHGAGPLERR